MTVNKVQAAVIGAGPAGLMAALQLAEQGFEVDVYDAMPSVGRKFLLAGIGGLNITHNESSHLFEQRFGDANANLQPFLQAFGAAQLRDWVHALGIETFVGTSQRVFPKEMKAAPLLRSWLSKLRVLGVRFHSRHRWQGWSSTDSGANLVFANRNTEPSIPFLVQAQVTILALGGASWQRLGSDGAWLPWLQSVGAKVAPLRPSNCGFEVQGGWSELLKKNHAGAPLKSVALQVMNGEQTVFERRGECVVTQHGIEGSLIYAASALVRNQIDRDGLATIYFDLFPDWTEEQITHKLNAPRGSISLSNHLRNRLGLDGIKRALVYESLSNQTIQKSTLENVNLLAALLKALPLKLNKTRPIDEAISTAGGVCFDALNSQLMLKSMPGVFCAGEMLDWEAPTGGYLLTACLSTGRAAGLAAVEYLGRYRELSLTGVAK